VTFHPMDLHPTSFHPQVFIHHYLTKISQNINM
jgi:hypothetical protein